ncbi:hypothetical protein [Aliarcobacter thereius]|nr:hypothetical protein [Aliarcobacter thereius]
MMEIIMVNVTGDLAFDYFFSLYFTLSIVLVPIFASISLASR